MSKFFKALEQAEQERALRQQTLPQAGPAGEEAPDRGPQPPADARSVPALGEEAPDGVEEHLVSLLAPTSFEAEQYRALRHLLEQLHKSAELAVVAVSSPGDDDGKTTTAINLAGALAQAPDARVLVVDADLRGGNLAKRLGLEEPAGPGFVEAILDSTLSLDVVARRRPPFNLSVLPAGRLPMNPYELLKSPRVGELLAEARRRYDYVILDTPPLVSVPDGRVIEKWVDGFLLVATAHKTPRKLLTEALTMMDPAKVVGLIFNGDDRPLSGYPDFYRRTRNGRDRGWPARVVQRVSGSLPSRFGRRKRVPSSDV